MFQVRLASLDELPACFAIRRTVFVAGQGVSEEEEIDGLDPLCVHFLAERDGVPVGTARLRPKEGFAKAERVAVLAEERGRSTGAAIMRALHAEAERLGFPRVMLHAQVAVIGFYEKLGYVAHGPVFDEADIPHRAMTLELAPGPNPA